MLTFTSQLFRLQIIDVTNIYQNNAGKYDYIYMNTEEDRRPVSVQSVELYMYDQLVKRVLLGAGGGGTGVYDHTALLDGNKLVTCCSDTVFCLSAIDLTLQWKVQADDATCFAVYKVNGNYLIHGELEISMLNTQGNILWQRSGAEIFVTLEGNSSLVIKDEHIMAIDFERSKYTFDFEGYIVSYERVK